MPKHTARVPFKLKKIDDHLEIVDELFFPSFSDPICMILNLKYQENNAYSYKFVCLPAIFIDADPKHCIGGTIFWIYHFLLIINECVSYIVYCVLWMCVFVHCASLQHLLRHYCSAYICILMCWRQHFFSFSSNQRFVATIWIGALLFFSSSFYIFSNSRILVHNTHYCKFRQSKKKVQTLNENPKHRSESRVAL